MSTHEVKQKYLQRPDMEQLTYLPAGLHQELLAASRKNCRIVAAYAGERPVAFAYVAAETEKLWDISIDTWAPYRRQGYAAAVVLHLIHDLDKQGKSAVWGALETNPASANLARKLGFVACDRLWVLTRTGRLTEDSRP